MSEDNSKSEKWVRTIKNCPIEITSGCPMCDHRYETIVMCKQGKHVWLYIGRIEEFTSDKIA